MRIVLSNGVTVHIRRDLVTIKGGSEIEDANCVVYYKDTPTEENIYKVEISGYDPAPEPAPEPLPPIEEEPAAQTGTVEPPAEQTDASEAPAEENGSDEENG